MQGRLGAGQLCSGVHATSPTSHAPSARQSSLRVAPHAHPCPALVPPGGPFALLSPVHTCPVASEGYLLTCRRSLAPPRQVLLVNGLNAGSRNKKELQDRMSSMQLFNPLCVAPDSASGNGPPNASAPAAPGAADAALPPLPDAGCMAALGWLAQGQDAAAPEVPATAAGSCCALPAVRVRLQGGDILDSGPGAAAGAALCGPLCARSAQQQQQLPLPQQKHLPPPQQQQMLPQDLPPYEATVASAGALAGVHSHVVVSPEAGHQAAVAVDGRGAKQSGRAACWGQAPVGDQEEPAEQEGPEWLVRGIAAVAERSQGSSEAVAGQQLLGRRWAARGWRAGMLPAWSGAGPAHSLQERLSAEQMPRTMALCVQQRSTACSMAPPLPPVSRRPPFRPPAGPPAFSCRRIAFVLLEDFDQPDPRGIVDTVEAGVLQGQ